MDISKARCANCDRAMTVTRMHCEACDLRLETDFEIPALARLSVEDQVFVVAFVRHHGSIKKMERLFGISYPTVKNRLNRIARELDRSFEVPSTNSEILDRLARGEISVDEALEELE
jgi:hypothetical protein